MTEPEALFAVPEPPRAPAGTVVQSFDRLALAGLEAGTLVDEDRALIAGTRVLAAALDAAEAIGGLKGGYLAAQALPPFQRALHALRLPVELTAVSQPASRGEGQSDTPDWARDTFGTAE